MLCLCNQQGFYYTLFSSFKRSQKYFFIITPYRNVILIISLKITFSYYIFSQGFYFKCVARILYKELMVVYSILNELKNLWVSAH